MFKFLKKEKGPENLKEVLSELKKLKEDFKKISKELKKLNEKSKFSHATDWTFIILLLLTTLTGIGIFICRISNAPLAGFYMYLIHLMVAIPMLMIEVPFSKWAHLAYRPVAIYFNRIIGKASELQQQQSINLSTTEVQ